MSTVTLATGHTIGDYLEPYIVAELNTSHFGDIDIAKEMIRRARDCGCNCVKFQSWSAETLYSEQHYRENPVARRMVNKFSLDPSQLLELSKHAQSLGIDFASTPYSLPEADWLVSECGVPFIKVASMDLTNTPFLEELGALGAPIVLSTGMGSLPEIEEAVTIIERAGNRNIAVLHCTSIYPALPSTIRLRNIEGLRSRFPSYPIGYSDHSLGIDIASASIALGACLVEKHFTLDKSRIGMDNQMATEPDEMAALVKACKRVHEALGDPVRVVGQEELIQRRQMRRSVVTSHDIEAGHSIGPADLALKRPGTGIQPCELQEVLGRSLSRDLPMGTVLRWEDLE